ncbi:hypothetical protein [Ammonifex thiophilus]|uniref:Uncharacterized protein n=1 Tax=Ammonifex thiophilus TaxID=444093 RepID=A0A3D8P2G5_9THEO|nr:hypothetical protein [Ammonifex thiophilus]RDV80410.1 hypothetical protein DXX99_10915 [Ammonifex thiophilus]
MKMQDWSSACCRKCRYYRPFRVMEGLMGACARREGLRAVPSTHLCPFFEPRGREAGASALAARAVESR